MKYIYPKKIVFQEKVVSIKFVKEVEFNGEKYKIYKFMKNPTLIHQYICVNE